MKTRSNDEIESAIEELESELSRLPDEDIFGSSNDKSKSELRIWISELRQKTYDHDFEPTSEEVTNWLVGEYSEIHDIVQV